MRADIARPPTSNLNLIAGQTAAVLAITSLSDAGQLSLYNSGGPTHPILDVEGWFDDTSDYTPVTPVRLVDTRGPSSVPYGQDTDVAAVVRGHAPPGSGAAVLSVTAVNPSASGYVPVHAGGTAVPVAVAMLVSSETIASMLRAAMPESARDLIAHSQPVAVSTRTATSAMAMRPAIRKPCPPEWAR